LGVDVDFKDWGMIGLTEGATTQKLPWLQL
jgi:hypothetical protein